MDQITPDSKTGAVPSPDDVLEVDLEDLPEDPAEAPGAVLEVNLDDDEAPGNACTAADQYPAVAGMFPAVTAQQAQAATAAVTLGCACSVKRESFVVRFEEIEPGFFFATAAEPCAKSAAAEAGGASEIQGEFAMGPEFECPYCHCGALILCSGCGGVICTGAAGKRGELECPRCAAQLTVTGEPARAVRGSGGKGRQKGFK